MDTVLGTMAPKQPATTVEESNTLRHWQGDDQMHENARRHHGDGDQRNTSNNMQGAKIAMIAQ